jgi:hypothetical protein
MHRMKGEHGEEACVHPGHVRFIYRFVIRVFGEKVEGRIDLRGHPDFPGVIGHLGKGVLHFRGQCVRGIGVQDSFRKLDDQLEQVSLALVEPFHRKFGPDPAEYDHEGGQSQDQSQEIDERGPAILDHDPQDHFEV